MLRREPFDAREALPVPRRTTLGAPEALRIPRRESFDALEALLATHFFERQAHSLRRTTPIMKSPARHLAVLKLPEYQVPQLLTQARSIVQCMTGNPSFPAPIPSLAAIDAAIDNLADAETAAHARTVGAVAARDAKRVVLKGRLRQLLATIQAAADANPEHGASIIESAGVSVKRPGVPPPRVFTVKPGPVSGSITLSAPKAAHRAGYEWAYSLDGGATWTSLPFTVHASARITGLNVGTTVRCRYRAATKDGEGNWSDVLSRIVV